MAREKKKKGDQREEMERALEREEREDLVGDMEENRNLTGSTTWETLGEKHDDEDQQRGRRAEEASPLEEKKPTRPDDSDPPHTTTGPITSPKFGSAGSGGLEYEPGPKRD